MTSPTPTAEFEVVKEIYAAINRNDIPAAIGFLHPKVEWIEPPDFPTPGTYRGHTEVLAHIKRGRGTWAEGCCEIEDLIAEGDRIIVFLHVRVRLEGRTEWIDGRFADVHTFHDGKAIEIRTFGRRSDALEWAGVMTPPPEASNHSGVRSRGGGDGFG